MRYQPQCNPFPAGVVLYITTVLGDIEEKPNVVAILTETLFILTCLLLLQYAVDLVIVIGYHFATPLHGVCAVVVLTTYFRLVLCCAQISFLTSSTAQMPGPWSGGRWSGFVCA